MIMNDFKRGCNGRLLSVVLTSCLFYFIVYMSTLSSTVCIHCILTFLLFHVYFISYYCTECTNEIINKEMNEIKQKHSPQYHYTHYKLTNNIDIC